MIICFYKNKETVTFVERYFYDKFGVELDQPDEETVVDKITHCFFVWKHVADCGGRTGRYARKMSGYDFIEIRIKDSNALIRFPYFRDVSNNRLVLLLGFEKKDGYKKGDKISRFVNKKFREAQKYYDEYKKNNDLYIGMPDVFSDLYNEKNF